MVSSQLSSSEIAPSPVPGPSPKEVTVGSLLERTFKAWWKTLPRLVAVTAIVMVPLFALMALFFRSAFQIVFSASAGKPMSPENATAFLGWMPVMIPVGIIVYAVLAAAQVHGVASHLGGRPAGIGEMFAVGFRRFLPTAIFFFLFGLALTVGLMLLFIPGIFLMTALAPALPSVVAERRGPLAAFSRGFELTKGHRWTVLGAGIVTMLAMYAGSLVNMMAVALTGTPLAMIVSYPLSMLFGLLMVVFPVVAFHDLRVAREGLGAGELAKVFE